MTTSSTPNDEDAITTERMAADQRWFVASLEQFDKFIELIGQPLPSTARLNHLAALPSPFSSEYP